MATKRFDVELNVNKLDQARWDRWCDEDAPADIEYGALQADGLEHWTLTAQDLDAARTLVEFVLQDWPEVDLISIKEG